MRVNITYSVDIEQILPEVSRRIDQCLEEIKSIEEVLSSLKLEEDLGDFVNKINTARNKMLSIDYNLGDNVKIINGYIEVKESISREEKEAGEIYE